MKRLLLILALLLWINPLAMAHPSSVSVLKTRIVDDGQTLSIDVNGVHDGRFVRYHQTVAVVRMMPLQKEWLTYRAFASQNLPLPLGELTGLLLTAGGLLLTVLTLIVLRVQARKPALIYGANVSRVD